MAFRGPLARSYLAAVLLVLLALCPYLVLTTAGHPLDPLVGHDLGLSTTGLALTAGFANAGYSFGCVLAAQLAQKSHGRRLLALYSALFVLASVAAAWAPAPGVYIGGRILQGLTTGAMLIAAAPTLVLGWGPEKLPRTAVVMNLGIFGAVALGPVIGGAVAGGIDDWRVLFWVVAGLGAGALALIVLTFTDQEPMDPSAPWDPVGITLAGLACAALFFGVSYVSAQPLLSAPVLIPLVGGALALVGTILWEYHARRPLMPLRGLAHTYPVVGILTAMIAGASSVSLVELAQTALDHKGSSVLHAGLLFLPELGGALIAAVAFGALFRTRYPPALAFSGLLLMGAGGALLVGASTGPDVLVAVGTGLVGLGTGFSVAPALFVAGFSLPSRNLPRIFALIELLRGVAAFLAGPLLLHLAETVGGDPVTGLRTAGWIAFAMPLGGAILVLAVFLLGHGQLRRPHIERWVDGEEPAIDSSPIFARVRRKTADHRVSV
ncbi:MAG TPA: MFS transporter [Solirubrobacteraceae bacterium]